MNLVFQVMSKQPETKQMVKKFVWCQWDCYHQQLYYIHYRHPGTTKDQSKDHSLPIMSAIQFYHDAQYENIVSILIIFLKKKTRYTCYAD